MEGPVFTAIFIVIYLLCTCRLARQSARSGSFCRQRGELPCSRGPLLAVMIIPNFCCT